MSRRFVFAMAAAASVFVCGAAYAQALSPSGVKAQEIFDRARSLTEGGKSEPACPLFAQSYALDPQVGALLNLAYCYESTRRLASAWLIWLNAAEAADGLGQTERAAMARERARQLEPRLLRVPVTVALQSTPVSINVRLDGTPLDRELWNTEVPLDEGEHEIVAGGDGLQRWSSRFLVAPGEMPAVLVPDLALLLPPMTPVEPASIPEQTGSSPLRLIAWTVGGAGMAALGVGAGFGVAGMINKNAATQDHDCVARDGMNICNPAGASDLSRARQDMTVADVGYAAGGGLLVTGAVMWFMARGRPANPAHAASRVVVVQPALARGSWSVALCGAW